MAGKENLAPRGVKVWNPAFDVTPANLITAIITDRGVCRAPLARSLAKVKQLEI
jgi:methylthioribose-1-phosphate isomerase